MSGSVLLDTCAAIWIMKRMPLSIASRKIVQKAYSANAGVFVSPLTAWEVGMLVSKGRLTLTIPPEVWFSTLIEMPGIRLAPLTPAILLASTALPGTPPSDPADRIIAATARVHGYVVITRDGKLLEYAREGHIRATMC
jgi:PIN domain nuclease of toxin-antitoxin system